MRVQESLSVDDESQMLTPTSHSNSIAPLEELQNLAGGNDIKVPIFSFLFFISCESQDQDQDG